MILYSLRMLWCCDLARVQYRQKSPYRCNQITINSLRFADSSPLLRLLSFHPYPLKWPWRCAIRERAPPWRLQDEQVCPVLLNIKERSARAGGAVMLAWMGRECVHITWEMSDLQKSELDCLCNLGPHGSYCNVVVQHTLIHKLDMFASCYEWVD